MFEEKMILKADKMERLTERLNWTPGKLADALNIDIKEAYKLLGGEAVNYYTAKAFISYFKAAFAVQFIDFEATGAVPPKFLRIKPIEESELFYNIEKNIKEKEEK